MTTRIKFTGPIVEEIQVGEVAIIENTWYRVKYIRDGDNGGLTVADLVRIPWWTLARWSCIAFIEGISA